MAFTPNHLSQQDPRWKSEQLGFDSSITIGTDGCALTCLTMLVNGYGFSETPSTINQKLKSMGPGGGFIDGLVIWGSLTRSFPKILYQNIIQWNNPPADLNSIDQSLNAGQPVVVEIDRSPAPGVQNHWVVLYGKQGDDYLMLDPWPNPPDSAPVTLGSRYASGRSLQDFILAAVWYLSQGPAISPTPPSGPGYYVQVNLDLVTGLHLRDTPATTGSMLATENAGAWLKVLEPTEAAQAKLGQQDQWLNVQDPQGLSGYVAAWYVHGSGQPAVTPSPAPAPTPAPSPAPAPAAISMSVVVSSEVTAGLNLRSQPNPSAGILATEPAGTSLGVLEPAATAQSKLGQQNQWLNVRDPNGRSGYVAAWMVNLPGGAPSPAPVTPTPTPAPASGLTVRVASLATAGLRMRDQPSMDGNPITVEPPASTLAVLEPAATAQAKIGQQDQWLNVRDAAGNTGYVAAWLVELPAGGQSPSPAAAGPSTPTPPSGMHVVVSSTASAGLRMRDLPSADGNILKVLMPGTILKVVEAASLAQAKVGQQNQWLNVQEPGGAVGYVAAWYVTL